MTTAFDFSDAELIHAPQALRDGGSVVLVLRVQDVTLRVRYAGGFGDALRNHDGTLEVSPFHEQASGRFLEPDECPGLALFISRHEAEFGKFADHFLGKRRRTDEQINEIRMRSASEPKPNGRT